MRNFIEDHKAQMTIITILMVVIALFKEEEANVKCETSSRTTRPR